MAVAQFNGRVVLSGTNLIDSSVVPNSKTRWTASFSFADNAGKYLGSDVAIGDVVVLDTGGVDIATITSYGVISITSSNYNSFRVIMDYLPANNNPAGPPDISAAIDIPGVIIRKSTIAGLSALPDSGIQTIPTAIVNQIANDNSFNVLDTLISSSTSTASPNNIPSTIVSRDETGGFATTAVTTTSITTQSLAFSGTGPVAISSGSDINLNAPGLVALNTLMRLTSRTKAQLTALVGVPAGSVCYCSNTVSGAMLVYFNGTAWLKVADNGAI